MNYYNLGTTSEIGRLTSDNRFPAVTRWYDVVVLLLFYLCHSVVLCSQLVSSFGVDVAKLAVDIDYVLITRRFVVYLG